MSHTPHDLHDEFPGEGTLLHRLKLDNAHFATLSKRYHDLNREIHRAETEIDPASDDHVEELKKRRLALLDEIAAMIDTEKG